MAIKLRPSRRGNFTKTGDRLAELGIRFVGYDHHQQCYVGVEIPPELEAVVRTDPLIDVDADMAPAARRSGPVWSSNNIDMDLAEVGARLRRLRDDAGLDLEAASKLTAGALSADTIDEIERTGTCGLQSLIVLADLYATSIDHLAGRSVIRGSRRR
jgi:hypothetical protein